MTDEPLLRAAGVSKAFDRLMACQDVSLELWPGEVLGIVGESGSGKTTLLRCLAGELAPTSGTVEFRTLETGFEDVHRMGEARRRFLMRTQWGVVHQNPRDGLRMGVSAGGNVGERLMAGGARHYGRIRAEAVAWLGSG
jgi:putative phosphonate transport system ATP-binding protein